METERLIMRRWQESDRAPFAELNADPETMRFFPNTLDREASDAMIETIETRFDRQGFGFWALEVAATGMFIGFTGLNPLPDGVPGAGGMEVGWRLARHAWHHGYATEAARAALGVAFDDMGLPEIWSLTAVLNEPSQAVMRRLGLTETDRFDHPGSRRAIRSGRRWPTTAPARLRPTPGRDRPLLAMRKDQCVGYASGMFRENSTRASGVMVDLGRQLFYQRLLYSGTTSGGP